MYVTNKAHPSLKKKKKVVKCKGCKCGYLDKAIMFLNCYFPASLHFLDYFLPLVSLEFLFFSSVV